MFRVTIALFLGLTTAALLIGLSDSVTGCALVRRVPRPGVVAPPRVEVAEESAIIIWDAKKKMQHFIRRVSFKTDASDFGFLVPTPTRPELAEAEDAAFGVLERATAPVVRIVMLPGSANRPHSAPRSAKGGPAPGSSPGRSSPPPPPVTVLEIQRVAGFDAAVLEATDAKALNDWLKKHEYQSRPELVDWLDAYVKAGWKITAFKIAKDQPEGTAVHTSAVRMSFKTEQPFFPYREPADQLRIPPSMWSNRLLRVYFLSDQRYQGPLGKDGYWPGKTVFAGKIDAFFYYKDVLAHLKLKEPSLAELRWLTEFEDRSSPRPGTDEVYFSPSADQTAIARPEVIRYVYSNVLRPLKPVPRPPISKLQEPSRSGGGKAVPPAVNDFPQMLDSAFERHVDVHLLHQAWAEVNPSLLTDVALQLADAERVLVRQDATLTAQKLLSLAVKLAAEKQDQATLSRLAKAAERLGNKGLGEEVRVAQKLAGVARAPEPGVSLDDLTPESLAIMQAYHRAILRAKFAGHKDILAGLSRSVDEHEELTGRQRAQLKRRIEQAIHAGGVPDQAARVLEWWMGEN